MKLKRFSVTAVSRLAAAVALSLAALALFAGAAQACDDTGGEAVFSPWNDQHGYTLAPDGGFENGAEGWTLSGGAAVVEGNERYQLAGAADAHSLALPEGSSALSPPICTDSATHQIRLLGLNGGDPTAGLDVDVVRDGSVHSAGTVTGGDEWAPSRKLPLNGPAGTVQIQLTPEAGSSWLVDDVYVDPFARH